MELIKHAADWRRQWVELLKHAPDWVRILRVLFFIDKDHMNTVDIHSPLLSHISLPFSSSQRVPWRI